MSSRGRNDQSIGGIPVNGWRQRVKGGNDVDIDWEKRDHCVTRRLTQPNNKRYIKFQSFFGMEHLRFPHADRRQTQTAVHRFAIQGITFSGR